MKRLNIKNIKIKKIKYRDPLEIFNEYNKSYYSSLLTGNGPEDISRLSLIGYNPHAIIRSDINKTEINFEKNDIILNGNIFNHMKSILENINFKNFKFPVSKIGLVGYLSFEAYKCIENIEPENKKNYEMPIMEFVLYNNYYYFDHTKNELFDIKIQYKGSSILEKKIKPKKILKNKINSYPEKMNYIKNIDKIIDYIKKGDLYEVNLTGQYSYKFERNSYNFFKKLYKNNPAPFSAYMNFGERKIISNSPEMFLKANENRVETRPIKGTVKTSINEKTDKKNRDYLLNSEKEQSELFMIIDLLRNDLSKVCEVNSVRVLNEKKLEKYENVYHLVGIIEGKLSGKKDYIDLIKATFPGGSITGCPKIRSIEIIKELEEYERNIYTGSIMILNNRFLDSSIVIRTAIIKDNAMYINSGGAITIDSKPEDEYQEMKNKISNFMRILNENNI